MLSCQINTQVHVVLLSAPAVDQHLLAFRMDLECPCILFPALVQNRFCCLATQVMLENLASGCIGLMIRSLLNLEVCAHGYFKYLNDSLINWHDNYNCI